jgi:hypothetical protein
MTMTTRDDAERCAGHGCNRVLVDTTVITARDGRRYCKRHGDRLPRYLRKLQRAKKVTARMQTNGKRAIISALLASNAPVERSVLRPRWVIRRMSASPRMSDSTDVGIAEDP